MRNKYGKKREKKASSPVIWELTQKASSAIFNVQIQSTLGRKGKETDKNTYFILIKHR